MPETISITQLQIAKPCHENWANMTKEEKGAFCKVCNKHVHDFTESSQEEILNYLQTQPENSVCGRVDTEVLQTPIIKVSGKTNRRQISKLALFAYSLYLVFGSLLFSCNSSPSVNENKIKTEETARTVESISKEDSSVKIQSSRKITVIKTSGKDQMPAPENSIPDTINSDAIVANGDRSYEFSVITMGCIVGHSFSYSIDTFDTLPPKKDSSFLETPAIALKLNAYPNPVSILTHIDYEVGEDGNVELELFNLSGARVMQIRSDNNARKGTFNEQINVSELPSGIYIVRMINNQHSLTTKLVVQH